MTNFCRIHGVEASESCVSGYDRSIALFRDKELLAAFPCISNPQCYYVHVRWPFSCHSRRGLGSRPGVWAALPCKLVSRAKSFMFYDCAIKIHAASCFVAVGFLLGIVFHPCIRIVFPLYNDSAIDLHTYIIRNVSPSRACRWESYWVPFQYKREPFSRET